MPHNALLGLRERHLDLAAPQGTARGAVISLACARDVDLLGLRDRRTDADCEQNGGQKPNCRLMRVEAFSSPIA